MKLENVNGEVTVDKAPDEIKEDIFGLIHDMTIDFMAYDRKCDEEYSKGCIEEAVKQGALTLDDIVAEFRKQMEGYIR